MKGILFILIFITLNFAYTQTIREMKFENVSLGAVIKSLSKATNKNIIIDPDISDTLNQRIYIYIRKPVSISEAFNLILKEYGLIAVPYDGYMYKITKAGELEFSISEFTDEQVEEIINLLKVRVSPSAEIVIDKSLRKIFIRDEADRITKINEMLSDIRRVLMEEELRKHDMKVFYLKPHVSYKDVKHLIERENIDVEIKEVPEFNAIVVSGSPENVNKVGVIIEEIVKKTTDEKPVLTKTIYLKYINADTFKRLVQPYLSEIGEIYILGTGIETTIAEEKELREIKARIEALRAQLNLAPEAERPRIQAQIQELRRKEQELARILDRPPTSKGDNLQVSGFPSPNLGTLGPEFSKQRSARTLLSNAVIIRDYAENIYRIMDKYGDLISEEPIQIKIEARIVEVQKEYLRELGLNWDVFLSQRRLPTFSQGGGSINAPISGGLAPLPLSPGLSGITGGLLAFSYQSGIINALNLRLSALERVGKAKSLAKPVVFTLNGEPAVIQQMLEYPIVRVTVSGNAFSASAEYKIIPLNLAVTPVLTPDGKIMLDITVAKQDIIDFVSVPVSVQPPINQEFPVTLDKKIDTKVVVNDGDVVVIGGVLTETNRNQKEGVPGLMRLPILGWLFREERLSKTDSELLIFIRPEVVVGQ